MNRRTTGTIFVSLGILVKLSGILSAVWYAPTLNGWATKLGRFGQAYEDVSGVFSPLTWGCIIVGSLYLISEEIKPSKQTNN